jgi:hypothetical protein
MVNQTVMKIKGDISYGVEFGIYIPYGMRYIIDDRCIKGIICDIDLYNKSYQTCRKHMKKILNEIKSNHKDYYDNEYLKAMEEEENQEDPLGLRYVF